jgi:glycosyltransferase involved in cell wall biosynthesis
LIAIVTPYGRQEVTAAALRLAGLTLRLGLNVRVAAVGRSERPVDPYWDAHTVPGNADGLYKAARGCTHVVHFGCYREWYDKTSLTAAKDAAQIVVAAGRPLAQYAFVLRRFSTVVCPTASLCAQITKAKPSLKPKLKTVLWDAGVAQVVRDGLVDVGVIRVCFVCDREAGGGAAPPVVRLVRDLIDRHPWVVVTLVIARSWSRPDRKALYDLKRAVGRRLTVHRRPPCPTDYHAHDWVVFPGGRSEFGIEASRAMACGAAVIAPNAPPYSEIVESYSNGLLVTAPRADPAARLAAWLAIGKIAFTDEKPLLRLQTKDWGVAQTAVDFDREWTTLLGL